MASEIEIRLARLESVAEWALAEIPATRLVTEILLANFLAAAPSDDVRADFVARINQVAASWSDLRASNEAEAVELSDTAIAISESVRRLLDRAIERMR